jgi:D-sedoheptulose 7-phosphate isomerase
LREVLNSVPEHQVKRAIELLLQARARGSRVYVIGNGGSATTASHFVCDLVKTARVSPHAPLRAFALTDNMALLTAWSNDVSYEQAFAGQLEALLEPNDVVIAISASGNSPNIVAALRTARERGSITIGLLGFQGGAALSLVDVPIHVPIEHYGLAEDTHSAISHAISMAIRASLSSDGEAHR